MSAYFGLDLGSSSLKLCQVTLHGTKEFVVEAVGLVSNPAGSVDLSDIQVQEKIRPALKQLVADAKIRDKRVVVSVPEAQVFSRIVAMPVMAEAELSSAIKWEAEQFVPIPVSDVEIDFSIVSQPPKGSTEKNMLVYLVAAPKKNLQALVDFLISVGLEPIAVESEMVAVTRAFTFGVQAAPTLLLHIGALSSVLAIVEGGNLNFSYVSETGGVALTRALSQSLSLPLPQAEEYKRTYGVDPRQLEGKIRSSLLIVLDSLILEAKKAMEFQLTQRKSRVTRIILSGGGAYLPEFATHLSSVFGGLEVSIGDPFAVAKPGRGITIPKERAVYSVAVGLAQRIF